jgi:hypothetical protein
VIIKPDSLTIEFQPMSDPESGEVTGSHRQQSDASPAQLESIAGVFRELFNLLEQYAPVWYTEEHQGRAVEALRALEESRQLAKAQAARSQKAG